MVSITAPLDSIEPVQQEPNPVAQGRRQGKSRAQANWVDWLFDDETELQTNRFDKIAHNEGDKLVIMAESPNVDLTRLTKNVVSYWGNVFDDDYLLVDCSLGAVRARAIHPSSPNVNGFYFAVPDLNGLPISEHSNVIITKAEELTDGKFWELLDVLRPAERIVMVALEEKNEFGELVKSLRCYEPESVIDLGWSPDDPCIEPNQFDSIAHSGKDRLVAIGEVDLWGVTQSLVDEWTRESTGTFLIVDCTPDEPEVRIVEQGNSDVRREYNLIKNQLGMGFSQYEGVIVVKPELLEGEQFWNLINALRTAKKFVILARDEKGGLADLTQSLRCYEPESVIDL